MFNIDESWYESAYRASLRDMRKRSNNLRWCPGVYTDPDTKNKTYCDVWTKYFLENCTPFNTFEELFKHVRFSFEEGCT